jgi:hypothetical protein
MYYNRVLKHTRFSCASFSTCEAEVMQRHFVNNKNLRAFIHVGMDIVNNQGLMVCLLQAFFRMFEHIEPIERAVRPAFLACLEHQ